MENFIYIALFSPLAFAVFSAFFVLAKKNTLLGYLGFSSIVISLIASLNLFFHIFINDYGLKVYLFEWMSVGNLNLGFSFSVDNISVVMMLVVTFVSSMVFLYSIFYMYKDEAFNRFFTYLALFVFSMLVLVLADNFAVLFIGWEAVGLCSWLLIGFWYHKKRASKAANEAFILNRIGDIGLMFAMFVIFWEVGSLDFDIFFKSLHFLDSSSLNLIAALLFLAAMGKSAQFPLHTWLANAMEGPTPVSALIHAATMVTAGVYLIIRCNELYVLTPDISYFIAFLGAFVAIFAASMAMVNNDLKRIIAYSTLSQLGFMFVAAGLGAYWVALFHLTTHAFFKSVLFLGAGNVMHAMNDKVDIRRMGNLHKDLKKTSYIMIIASLALSGIFPLSGFFSKDKILESAFANSFILWSVLIITAFLTAFYSFRLIMKVFFVKSNQPLDSNPHEASKIAIFSMLPLIFLAAIFGFFEKEFEEFTTNLLPTYSANLSYETIYILIIITSLVSVFGIIFAIFRYKNSTYSFKKRNIFQRVLLNQYYIPNIYNVFAKVYLWFSKLIFKYIEDKLIDKTIDNIAISAYNMGSKFKVIHNGNLSSYLRLIVGGALMFLIVVLILAIL